ncbi:hypothetical protein D3C76_1570560 [compost metagenome]
MHLRRVVGQQICAHLKAAATAQGQLCTVVQTHGDGTGAAGLQLLTGEQAVALHQQAPAAITVDRKYLTDHLADHTD